jgi:bile acid:Na+ symporter, BASS family
MNVLMPFMALAVGAPFDLHPAVKIALVVIAVSPTPPVFPKKALDAGGTEAYTIGLLVAVAVLSVVVIPLSMEVLAAMTGISLAMPARSVAVLVLTTILAPLVAGIAVRRFATTAADRAAGPIGVLATVLLIGSAVPIVIGVSQTVWSLVTDGTILGLVGFAAAGFLIGHVLGGPEPANRPVLGLATATRHPAVALAIAHANFPEQGLASAAVFLYVMARRRSVCAVSRLGQSNAGGRARNGAELVLYRGPGDLDHLIGAEERCICRWRTNEQLRRRRCQRPTSPTSSSSGAMTSGFPT